jgi:AraC-like DNA-binding protein
MLCKGGSPPNRALVLVLQGEFRCYQLSFAIQFAHVLGLVGKYNSWGWQMSQRNGWHPDFSEVEFDGALRFIDLDLQNYNWMPGENNLNRASIFGLLKASGITNALAEAVIVRLIEEAPFRPWSQKTLVGYRQEEDAPVVCYHNVYETTDYLAITEEKWKDYLRKHRRAAVPSLPNAPEQAVSPGPAPPLDLEERATETRHFLMTTQQKSYSFLSEQRRLQKEAKQTTDAVAPQAGSFTKRKSPARGHAAALELEQRAIGALVMHSDWSIEQIADDLGVHRTTLYRLKKFRVAAAQAGKLKPRGAKNHSVRRGHKTQDGQIEAYADSVDDD